VVAQSLHDIEIICVDDGSTDDSLIILRKYENRDSRFRIIHQKNGGPGKARNTGLNLVTGKYLIFLDSDDWFEPNMLEEMVKGAESTEAEVVICESVGFDASTRIPQPSEWMLKKEFLPNSTFAPQEISSHLFQFTYGWPWDKLYCTEFVKRQGLIFPPLPNSEDLVFVFQSLAIAKKITVINKLLVHHRENRLSSVSNSRHQDPEVPYIAVDLLGSGLRERKLYVSYEKSYLNWAMDFLIWNASNMGDDLAQKDFFHELKQKWLPEMNFENHTRNYYENKILYYKYLLIKYMPWFIFFRIVKIYQFIKHKYLRVKYHNG